MKVAIIIVTWNNEKDIEICLTSILNQTYKPLEIVVVDNNSSDQTTAIVETKFPQVTLLREKKNLYLTGGNNIGIRYALQEFRPEYIMVLNPDTKSDPKLVENLVKALEDNEHLGAAGPKVKFWNNQNEGLINSAGLVFDGFMQAYDIGFMQKDDGSFDSPADVFGVTGACIMYKTKMLKEIGLYWDRIKMYLDEVEMFIRVHKKGWKVMLCSRCCFAP